MRHVASTKWRRNQISRVPVAAEQNLCRQLNPPFPPAAIFFVLVAGTVLALYGGSLNLWWCCDDPAILLHAHRYSPWEYFSVPDAWRSLIAYSLTPWLSLVYDLDLTVFGFKPAFFYAHQLVSIACCAWLLQRVSSYWVDQWSASVSSLLFVVGVPVASAAQLLMVRQYVDGLLLFLIALNLAIRALNGGHAVFRPLAMLFFALATTAKEVFVPLGFILFLLPIADFRRRLEVAWPWLLVMLLYVPWRWYMLGSVIGGYAPGAGLQSFSVRELAGAFLTVPDMLLGHPLVAGIGLLLLAIFALPKVWHRAWLTVAWLFLLPILLFTPLLPLVRFPGLSERYFIVPWAALAFMVSIALGLAWRNQTPVRRVALVGSVIAIVGAVLATTWPSIARGESFHAQFRAVGMASLENDASATLWVPAGVPAWFTQGLLSLRSAMGLTGGPPRTVSDASQLVALNGAVGTLLRYDAATQSMSDVSTTWPEIERQWRSQLDSGYLGFDLEYDSVSKVLRWTTKPEAAGTFTYISADGALPIPSQGQLRMEKVPTGCFRILLMRGGGTTSYSPQMIWPAETSSATVSRLNWAGGGDIFDSNQLPRCP